MTMQTNIAKVLNDAYELRSSRNSRYSLRAFARDMGMSIASLSLILNGKQGLSVSAAEKIADRLEFTPKKKEFFCDLVISTCARSERQRALARIRLRRHDETGASLELEMFKVIADWYHFAILELTGVTGFQHSTKWIAKALGITEKTANLAIDRLKKLELLEDVDGQLRRTSDFVSTPSGIPSEALKKYHSQLLQKAETALYTQSVQERDFSAVQFAVAKEDLPWAKEQIRDFRRSLMARMESNPRRDQVYCLSIGLFNLQNKQNKEK